MDNKLLQPGDIFLIDSDSTEAKIVKFLMSSDTIWHWLIGKIYELVTKKKAPNWLIRYQKYYHVGMIYSDTQTIEQQAKVEFQNISRLDGKHYAIIHRIGMTENEQNRLIAIAAADIGKGYDILLIIGKTLSYVTGIPFFVLLLNWPGKDLCVTRISLWYWKVFDELWGRKNYNFVQTDDMYYYAKAFPEYYNMTEYN